MKRRRYIVSWTPGRHKECKTKKEASEEMRAWKKQYEARGWRVSRLGDAFWATPPDAQGPFTLGSDPRHLIALREYDKETGDRVWTDDKRVYRITPDGVFSWEDKPQRKRHAHV